VVERGGKVRTVVIPDAGRPPPARRIVLISPRAAAMAAGARANAARKVTIDQLRGYLFWALNALRGADGDGGGLPVTEERVTELLLWMTTPESGADPDLAAPPAPRAPTSCPRPKGRAR